jgi:hypothetical protein
VRELVRALELHVVTIYKCSINPIINPNPWSSHEHVAICILSSYSLMIPPIVAIGVQSELPTASLN